MVIYRLSDAASVLAALSTPAVIITQSPLRFEYPAKPAPTLIIHTLMKKNIMLITMNITALSIVNPNANPIGAAALILSSSYTFVLYKLVILCLLFIFWVICGFFHRNI